MKRVAPTLHAFVPDACLHMAALLFTTVHASPTPENAERLACWLGEDPRHVRALDRALTEWGLVQSGHPVGGGEALRQRL